MSWKIDICRRGAAANSLRNFSFCQDEREIYGGRCQIGFRGGVRYSSAKCFSVRLIRKYLRRLYRIPFWGSIFHRDVGETAEILRYHMIEILALQEDLARADLNIPHSAGGKNHPRRDIIP